jgi:hypothetical protein
MASWHAAGAAFVAAALLAAPAGAQTWMRKGDRLDFKLAHVSFPFAPGTTRYYETREFSHKGTGLDTAAEFKSPDEAVFATVYAYLPTLAEPGLAAVATDAAIAAASETPTTRGPDSLVAAAGVPRAALETRYGAYRGTLASRAAFVRVDRWIVKVRVSGPAAREQEVDATMAAILEGMRVSGSATVVPAVALAAPPCDPAAPAAAAEAAEAAEAKLLPDTDESTVGNALLLAIDATQAMAGDGKDPPLPARLGTAWCRSDIGAGPRRLPVLRARDVGPPATAAHDRTALVVLYDDMGSALEIVRGESGFTVLNHRIGEAQLLGTFDRLPGDEQLVRLLTEGGEAAKVRSRLMLKPNGDTELVLPAPQQKPARSGRAGADRRKT